MRRASGRSDARPAERPPGGAARARKSSKTMVRPNLKLVSPDNENRTVGAPMPSRLANAEYRTLEYLTPSKVERLVKVAGKNRYSHHDATMVLVCYRHGLRASELVSLE